MVAERKISRRALTEPRLLLLLLLRRLVLSLLTIFPSRINHCVDSFCLINDDTCDRGRGCCAGNRVLNRLNYSFSIMRLFVIETTLPLSAVPRLKL